MRANQELVLNFSETGVVSGMHMDQFDLGFLGKKSVERATEIKFDEDAQTWGLYLPIINGWLPVPEGMGFGSYEVARRFEVSWINICRAKDIQPSSEEGRTVLSRVRELGDELRGRAPTLDRYELQYP